MNPFDLVDHLESEHVVSYDSSPRIEDLDALREYHDRMHDTGVSDHFHIG